MEIRATFYGKDEVLAALAKMAAAIPEATDKAARAGAVYVRGRAVKEGFRIVAAKDPNSRTGYGALGAPIAGKLTRRTGALQASIRDEPAGRGRAAVGPTAKYGAIHEFGGRTGPHTISARKAKALRFMVGGKVIYRKSVQHPGSNIPPRPYLRPAFEGHRAEVLRIMVNSLAKSLGVHQG